MKKFSVFDYNRMILERLSLTAEIVKQHRPAIRYDTVLKKVEYNWAYGC